MLRINLLEDWTPVVHEPATLGEILGIISATILILGLLTILAWPIAKLLAYFILP